MKEFDKLVEIVRELRGPDGCPWDHEQTHRSLRPCLLEEAYEVIEALDSGDIAALKGELGDLLLQVVFHSQIAAENGDFSIEDVAKGISDKLVHRHPHVFGSVVVNGADDVMRNWEQLKRQEKEAADRKSALDGVPQCMPALQRALKVQKKAARVGFDWDDPAGPLAKIHEEIGELEDALSVGDRAGAEQELGDVLFSVVNYARFLEIDSESALREAIARFTSRFADMESAIELQGQAMTELGIDELEEFWQQAKSRER